MEAAVRTWFHEKQWRSLNWNVVSPDARALSRGAKFWPLLGYLFVGKFSWWTTFADATWSMSVISLSVSPQVNQWTTFFSIARSPMVYGPQLLVVLSATGCPPWSITDLFDMLVPPLVFSKGKIMWRLSFLACTWSTWKERNRRCFEWIASPSVEIIYRMKFCVSSWASILP